MDKRVIFIASHKGGAGKSTFARALLDLLRQADDRVTAAFDADGDVGQLLQFMGTRDSHGKLHIEQDPEAGCGYFTIADPYQRDELVNVLDHDYQRILFDLPGGSVSQLSMVVDEGDEPVGLLNEFHKAGFSISVAILMTPVIAGLRTVQNTMRFFGDGVDYIAVRNLSFGEPSSFFIFDGITDDEEGLSRPPSLGKTSLLNNGGHVINLPKLEARTYALLDLYNLSFTQGMSDERLPYADRARVRQWVQRFSEQLEVVDAELGLKKPDEIPLAETG